MKSIILTLTLVVTPLLILTFAPSVLAQDLPAFNVHVAPNGNCSGNQANAYVRIEFYYQGQLQTPSTFTDDQGWAYFTAPVGQVYVYSTKGAHSYGCYHTQPAGGSQHYICLDDTFCYLKDKDMAFGNRFGVYGFCMTSQKIR